jgi:hypothetical protein
VLLLASDYFAVLMISNVCYMVFIFLNLQSGWIHRLDRPNHNRPFRCPNWLLALGALLGFVNLAFVGAGADVWGEGTLRNGLIGVLLIVPVFLFRHYVQDKGQFPPSTLEEYAATGGIGAFRKRAGALPWLALAAGVAVVAGARYLSVLT